MRTKVCYQHVIAGYTIKLEQLGLDNFRVTYGQQERALLGYDHAAKELGEAIMHALACEGKLENGVDA